MIAACIELHHGTTFVAAPPTLLAGDLEHSLQITIKRAITSMGCTLAVHAGEGTAVFAEAYVVLDAAGDDEGSASGVVTVGPILRGKFNGSLLVA